MLKLDTQKCSHQVVESASNESYLQHPIPSWGYASFAARLGW